MAIGVMQDVWTRSQASGGDRLVLLALADSANADTRECWPSLARIAERCRLSVRQTQRALRRVEEAGEVSTVVGQGRGMTNVYRICLDGGGDAHDTLLRKGDMGDRKGDISEAERVTSVVEKGVTGVTRNRKDPSECVNRQEPSL